MINESSGFADSSKALQILKNYYPNAKKIVLVERGYDNIVGLIDELYAVRFPRNINAYKRSQYEKVILKNIEGLKDIQAPRLIDEKSDPHRLITKFLPGRHLRPIDINRFSKSSQIKFGEDVGKLVYQIHSMLSVEVARNLRLELGLDLLEEEPWDIHLKNMLLKYQFPTKTQDDIAKRHYGIWHQNSNDKKTVVVHDDLHTENMLFEGEELTGILDFGDTNIGTPEQELRQLYRINEDVVRAAADSYSKLSGYTLDIGFIKTWSIVQELGVYADRLIINDVRHPSFLRACRNLNAWASEGQWGEGLYIGSESGLQ